LRQVYEALVFHNALYCLHSTIKIIEFDEDRVLLGLRLKQRAAAQGERGSQ
jgi:hypothetical protein